MLDTLLLPIVAAAVTLAVLVAIPVLVVRTSLARRRDEALKRTSYVEPGEGDDEAPIDGDGAQGPGRSPRK